MSLTQWLTRSSPTVSCTLARAATSTLVPTPSVDSTSTGCSYPGGTRARGVEHLLERVGRHLEGRVAIHQQRAVLTLLDHGHLGPTREHPVRGPVDVPVARELAGLGIVHHEDVDVTQQLEQQVALRVNPIVHGVARHERRVRDLLEDAQLQLGVDVSEKHKTRLTELLGELGPELGEHTEPRV